MSSPTYRKHLQRVHKDSAEFKFPLNTIDNYLPSTLVDEFYDSHLEDESIENYDDVYDNQGWKL